uniref:Receptor kinase-like protein Xa21 n=1 Tax=Saccharum hybrid cultivar R570 TaxID=131158 RepID=A0A059PZ22_9POAL|nr:hypothetical protein SHCRBa_010_J05_R_310 [Saccharum hybrid cultivar R570]
MSLSPEFPLKAGGAAAGVADDKAALLAFKTAAISGGYDDPLPSWNDSSSSSSSSAGGFCSWEGVTCGRGNKHRQQRVVALSLHSRGLVGYLSPAIGNLSSLRVLNLSSNTFSGAIPASIGCLHHLRDLDIRNNTLTGDLPANLTSCTKLTAIHLGVNQLQGRVPRDLGAKLMLLQVLNLLNNNLTGAIPASLANLSSLSALELSDNYLTGEIPPGLGGIQGLQGLDLAINLLVGEPPCSLYNLSSLTILQLEANMLYGNIPADIGNSFPGMRFLSFADNQFTGSIPASLSNLTALVDLELDKNSLSGYVPRTLGQLGALQTLYLYKNMLQANDTEGWEFITSLSNCSQLQELHIGNNVAFTGQLPTSIANLSTTLKFFLLRYTRVSGSIPSDIANLVNLELLSVANTCISGVVPESIGKLGNLVELEMRDTQLSGLIPSSLGNISQLSRLYGYNGKLEGSIPASLGKLRNLAILDLSMNHLNGSIPKDIFRLPVLRICNLSYNLLSRSLPSEVGSLGNLNVLVLSGNQLSDEIPGSIGSCTVLERLMLDNNSFQGTIPQSICNIKGLSALYLSMNKLSGTIPNGIGSIRSLQYLYMAHNNLSGTIPTTLQNLTSLYELDLSFNNLQGEVPREGIFRNLTRFSITGNNELCGGIPQLHLAPCHNNSVKKSRKVQLRYISLVLGTASALFFLGLAITLILFARKHKSCIRPTLAGEQYGRVSYHALSNGTNGFSEANLLGKGSFGAVYKCTFEDEGTTAAVKVFNLEQHGSTRSFMAECEALRKVRHRCLIKIITCCSSINHQGQEFKALVFEFMPNGSLNDWLHPKFGLRTPSNTLNLAQRLDIAVDVMDALDFLHNHCHPPIIHCDIKPSNILLAEDMSVRVGDFGLSRILSECASQTIQNSNSMFGIRGSVGYVAPEYGEDSSVSTLGDVYSLGILLLELFTGKSPIDDMFRGSLDLHKFCKDALPKRIWEVADTAMWLHTATHDITTRTRIESCLISAIGLGMSCSEKQPRKRILIHDATMEMHAIRDSYLIFARPLEA